jgi:predicted ATPase/class 3 adenylate cyclase
VTVAVESSGELTFLFTDMEASTRAWERDVAAMDAAQRRHDAILRQVIAAHHGRIFATAGDGLAAAFVRADEAVAAAVDAQRRLLQERWPNAAPVSVRMGLHTGAAIERDGDYFGPTVIRAARLMSLVDGGRIVCSARTAAALPSSLEHVELLPIGTVQLKGLSAPEAAVAVRAPGLPETGERVDDVRPLWWRPSIASSLIARDALVADVAAQVRPGGLVTLVGVGGVGKTRIAAAVADHIAPRHGEQVAWVDLTTVAEHSAVVHELATLLAVRASRDEDLGDKVATAIGDRDLVVVVDNCEHVLDAVRSLLRVLLARCPQLALLATSREPVGLPTEHVVAVRPLSTGGVESEGVDLLVERLGVRRVDLDDTAVRMLAEIAHRVDGIPLALELVAARCRRLGIVEVGRRLPGHLGQLADARRPARHQTLDRTIDWSYSMLAPAEQALWRSLSVFSGTFDLDAVDAVVDDGTVDVAPIVESLLDKSLLEQEGGRFRLLETNRDFAARRSSAEGEADRAAEAHARYVHARVVTIREGLHGRDEADWVAALDSLWPDVRTAVRRSLDGGDADLAIELVRHLAFEAFWRRPEAFAWIEEAADRWGDRPGPHRHELLGAAGVAAWTQFDVPRGIRLATAALDADPAPGTALDCLPEGAAIGAFAFSGQFDVALAVARNALFHLDATSDRWNLAVMYGNVANVLGISGADGEEFERAVEASISIAHSVANPTAIAYGYLVDALGTGVTDPDRARRALESARAYASEVDNRWVQATAATTIAMAPLGAEPDDAALGLAFDAAEELHRTGWPTHAWCAMWGVIAGLSRLGRLEAASLVLGACEASGVARLAYQHVPSELEDDAAPTAAFRRLGRYLPFDDLLLIATGRRPLPPLP